MLTFIVCLASDGRWARKERHVLAESLKGLNFAETSVMNLVIISRATAESRFNEGSIAFLLSQVGSYKSMFRDND